MPGLEWIPPDILATQARELDSFHKNEYVFELNALSASSTDSNPKAVRTSDFVDLLREAKLVLKSRSPRTFIFWAWRTVKQVLRYVRWHFQGWRATIACAAVATLTVFLANLVLLLYFSNAYSLDDGIGTWYQGSCDAVGTYTTIAHIFINVLSTIMLSASNYTMQCLSSPTREEIDQAHANGDWMDIGIPSARNIRNRVATKRIVLWWILGLSSVPIHLLYNSIIFKTLSTNVYSAAVVYEDFIYGKPFVLNNHIDLYPGYEPQEPSATLHAEVTTFQHFFVNNSSPLNTSKVEKLSNKDCIELYRSTYLVGRSDVIAVSTAPSDSVNGSLQNWFGNNLADVFNSASAIGLDGWLCPYDDVTLTCSLALQERRAENWTVDGLHVDYCLSRLEPANCKMQFSVPLLAVVVAFNLIKATIMLWVVFKVTDRTLNTLGDAIASFLTETDNFSQHRCLMSISDLKQGPLQWSLPRKNKPVATTPPPRVYEPRAVRGRLYEAASGLRWIIVTILLLAGLITSGILLGQGVANYANSAGSSVFGGFGSVNPDETINTALDTSSSIGLVSAVLLVNAPQAICSLLYLYFNGLVTAILLGYEWSTYYLQPKALRVSMPRGKQQSAYYLQIPFRFSIPLVIISATLHWLISEGIFLARIDVYSHNVPIPNQGISKPGYSCLPILLAILLGTVMLLGVYFVGAVKSPSIMPVAGSCSVAIAAGCQRPESDHHAALLPVSWGEVAREGTDLVGHCSFTSQETTALIPGRLYSGMKRIV